MDLNNIQTAGIGYFSSSIISLMHYQDFLVAFLLGFAGAAGAWVFKKLADRI